MKELIARTRELFAAGLPLIAMRRWSLRVDIELFSRGGLAVLDAIEASRLQHARTSPRADEMDESSGLLGARAWLAQVFPTARAPNRARRMRRDRSRQLNCIASRSCRKFEPRSTRQSSDRLPHPTRSATASRARRAAVSISRFSACRSPSATRFARSTRSCGWWTTFRTSRAISNRSAAGLARWRGAAR